MGESKVDYVARLKNELEAKIEELGPKNVAAFICEPIVGAVSWSFSYKYPQGRTESTMQGMPLVTLSALRLACF